MAYDHSLGHHDFHGYYNLYFAGDFGALITIVEESECEYNDGELLAMVSYDNGSEDENLEQVFKI